MATMMRRVIRGIGIMVAITAMAWSVFGGAQGAEASNGYEQWTGPDANGCLTYWDGYTYTTAACPRGDGSFDFYVPANGQWVLAYSAGYDANGCYFFWDGYQYTVFTCPVSAVQQQGQPSITYSTMGGQSIVFPDVVITNATVGTGYSTIGGQSLPADGSWTPTGNALIDSMMIEANYEANAVWLQPTCLAIVGNVCYY